MSAPEPRATDRPAVILLHASASSSRQWDALAEALADRYRVHALDLHGHGARPPWAAARPFRLGDDAALAWSLLAEVGPAHVVGHSYGGAVALRVALGAPASVRSLTLYEPVAFRLLIEAEEGGAQAREVVATAEAMRADVAAGDPSAAGRRFIDFWSGEGAWSRLSAARQAAVAGRMGTLLDQFGALFGEPLDLRPLAASGLPVRILRGSATVPTAGRLLARLREALPRAEHTMLAEAGHMGPVTHAAAFNREVAGFLDRLGVATEARARRTIRSAFFPPAGRSPRQAFVHTRRLT